MWSLPTISRFFGISIAMYFDDHGPPHFHARHPEGRARGSDRYARGDREQAWTPTAEVLQRMRGPVFDDARTPEGFAKVTVDRETGTVIWPGGADLAPDTLYERVRTGAWPEHDVAA
jgi:hypothetical protein